MNRPILVGALLLMAAASLGAQDMSQSSPYSGTSSPPSDDTITTTTTTTPLPKPHAGRHFKAAPGEPTSMDPSVTYWDPDGEIVGASQDPARESDSPLRRRDSARASAHEPDFDPDSDIVMPHPLRQDELGEGTTIRVRLIHRLSTSSSEKGEPFRSRVSNDVLKNGVVLLPAGTEIDGRVVAVSRGHVGGYGTMRLKPDTVLLPDGTRYRLHASVTGTTGSRVKMGTEGVIRPTSRLKRDGIQYGAAVGAGAATGAILGGPVGALSGGLIGAGLVTVHLLVSHPQATLETGTTLRITLSERLSLTPDGGNGD